MIKGIVLATKTGRKLYGSAIIGLADAAWSGVKGAASGAKTAHGILKATSKALEGTDVTLRLSTKVGEYIYDVGGGLLSGMKKGLFEGLGQSLTSSFPSIGKVTGWVTGAVKKAVGGLQDWVTMMRVADKTVDIADAVWSTTKNLVPEVGSAGDAVNAIASYGTGAAKATGTLGKVSNILGWVDLVGDLATHSDLDKDLWTVIPGAGILEFGVGIYNSISGNKVWNAMPIWDARYWDPMANVKDVSPAFADDAAKVAYWSDIQRQTIEALASGKDPTSVLPFTGLDTVPGEYTVPVLRLTDELVEEMAGHHVRRIDERNKGFIEIGPQVHEVKKIL
jgi:hypothetical protein